MSTVPRPADTPTPAPRRDGPATSLGGWTLANPVLGFGPNELVQLWVSGTALEIRSDRFGLTISAPRAELVADGSRLRIVESVRAIVLAPVDGQVVESVIEEIRKA